MVVAAINYLDPASTTDRFFWSPSGRVSTSLSVEKRLQIRNARTVAHDFTLDAHGFALVRQPTAVETLSDPALLQRIYAREVDQLARALTGADLVVPMGYELRSSAAGTAMLPPAARAHVDYNTPTAQRIARRRYAKAMPDGPGYDRFILFSLWRPFSPPPQDWPLALCDYASSKTSAEIRSVKIDVPRLPEGDALYAPIAGEDEMGASALFTFDPAHRWWYYPDMTRDEAIFIKFHDSDHSRAWRAPHCAFHDETTPNTVPRESIEFRGCAYFTKK